MNYPYLIFYTNNLPDNFHACTNGFIIRMVPGYKNDEGLLKHELIHVKQFWLNGLLIHTIRYRFSKSYRLKCEVEAYREQLKYLPATIDLGYYKWIYAGFMAERYGLNITKEEALRSLI